jgi:hypothetical protein
MGIITYTPEQIRGLANDLNEYYDKSLTIPLPYKEFRACAYNLMYDKPKLFGVTRIEDNTLIRVAPDTKEMLAEIIKHNDEFEDISRNSPSERKDFEITELCKKLLKPKLEFTYTPPRVDIEYNGIKKPTPMWYNTTAKGVNIRLGYDNGDSSTPSLIQLGDQNVHMMLGGATGAGKSVALNTVECNILVEYPPWEVDIYLGDFKKVEGSRYANRVPTPHMKIVAATSSTEFVMSVYQTIIDEMNNRSALFTKVGVQKIEDFRNKYNLVMPRVILIVDEFTQMYENIKQSEAEGNDSAAEDKKAINSALSAIARLGRSMGIHMLLSSQQLDDLDSSVANQFSAGVTLKAPPAVSTSLIGNDAGANIKGKGKGYYNKNKAAKSAADNIYTRIPFLSSEQTPEEAASGKLTDLIEILTQCYNNSQELGYDKGLVFYDEDAPIAYQQYLDSIEYAKNYVNSRKTSNLIDDIIFTNNLLAYLPLGPEIKLTDEPSYCLHLQAEKNVGVLVGSTTDDYRNYMLKLLKMSILAMLPNAKHTVISADESILKGAELDTIPNSLVKTRAVLDPKIINRVNTRNTMIKLYEYILDINMGNSAWDTKVVLQFLIETEERFISNTGCTIDRLDELFDWFEDDTLDGMSVDEVPEKEKPEQFTNILEVLGRLHGYKANYDILISNFGKINVQSFAREFVWFIGLENFVDIDDYEVKGNIKNFLENSGRVGIIPIVTGKKFAKTGGIVETMTHILDRADRTFFMDVGMPKKVNINPNSFQITEMLSKNRRIVSRYSKLSN